MRKVAYYAFDTQREKISNLDQIWGDIRELVDTWLDSKGTRDEQDGKVVKIKFKDNRVAELTSEGMKTGAGDLISWTLKEPIDEGEFKTTLTIARNSDVIAVTCELEVGAEEKVVQPVPFDAYCPNIVCNIIDKEIPWFVGETYISTRPIKFDGDKDGTDLAALITCETRSLPLIVVSEFNGSPLTPNIAIDIARDLAGLAIVASVSSSASWVVTNKHGRDWSCYNGAIRIYWPFTESFKEDPFKHPLWIRSKLLFGVDSNEEAAQRIRNQFRRRILGLSTFSFYCHPVFEEVRSALKANQQMELQKGEMATQELLRYAEEENERLEDENKYLKRDIDTLKREVGDLKGKIYTLEWALENTNTDEQGESGPTEELPKTVTEAVERAKSRYNNSLIFGNDINKGIKRLAVDAGPPDKILNYLESLADLSNELQRGTLGLDKVKWLMERNCEVSGESDTKKNCQADMKRRTWHDGSRRREFELHMKPSRNNSPDRNVRIYFDWDQDKNRVIVGWIGREPK